ncbi:hypothetical protein MUB24_16185 [Lederbergia sp. NSJ-179]|uniref:SIR2 family NAD-dependent protein deacylase n=1 Tax=Lederbergia sp. NSJ-179 TaxID=2931402 RepID=UPI001FD4430C|nr:Sir2 family NAD-dependent protein deacetylase [Lederbergia sp. NSJ-179]MCJ7842408.1 hypothetical protein [Lederbergia sp. NSJ-179]
MSYFACNSKYDFESKTLTILGAMHNRGEFRLCFAMITTVIPEYVQKKINNLSKINFQSNDFLTAEGEIVQQDDGQCVPLKGLSACWTPNSPVVLTDLLKNFYLEQQEVPQTSVENYEDHSTNRNYKKIQPNEVMKLLQGKNVLVFTGAGISIASEVPDLDGIMSLQQSIFHPPEQYFLDIIENKTSIRIEKAREYYRHFTASKPNQNHWYIKELCDQYGFVLATGNIDGLHEKTGMKPIYQTNSERVDIPSLEEYDIILTIGLGDEGVGIVVEEFKTRNDDGCIIAINVSPPLYLDTNDYYVEGDSEKILHIIRSESVMKRS